MRTKELLESENIKNIIEKLYKIDVGAAESFLKLIKEKPILIDASAADINGAIMWGNTDEGHQYWEKIHVKFVKNKFQETNRNKANT